MAENSKIEWTDHTFNPWIGCTKVSPGCVNCYAESMARRYGWAEWGLQGTRKRTSEANWKKPLAWNRAAEKTGKRTFVFCASLSDVFERRPGIMGENLIKWRADLWELIEATPALTWLLLTKRPEYIQNMLPVYDVPKNIALGTTVEIQLARRRIAWLTDVPAAFYFISMEPMLEPIHLDNHIRFVDWVIVGGESGPNCRPFNLDWARSVRDECRAAGVPFFMKQIGGHPDKRDALEDFPEDLRIREFPSVSHLTRCQADGLPPEATQGDNQLSMWASGQP